MGQCPTRGGCFPGLPALMRLRPLLTPCRAAAGQDASAGSPAAQRTPCLPGRLPLPSRGRLSGASTAFSGTMAVSGCFPAAPVNSPFSSRCVAVLLAARAVNARDGCGLCVFAALACHAARDSSRCCHYAPATAASSSLFASRTQAASCLPFAAVNQHLHGIAHVVCPAGEAA